MKKIVSLIMIFVLICSFSCNLSAATIENEIMPMWTNIYSVSTYINFGGTKGTATASITGEDGTERISATLAIYVQNSNGGWTYITHTGTYTNDERLILSVDFSGESGKYYKAVLNTVVTIDGVEESTTKTSYKTCS